MWIVRLVKPIPSLKNDFRAGYFPRKFAYKRDAVELQREVAAKGGEAVVERVKK